MQKLIGEATRPLEVRLGRLEGRVIEGESDPEGVVDAAPGTLHEDRLTGDVRRKSSPLGTLTGWVVV